MVLSGMMSDRSNRAGWGLLLVEAAPLAAFSYAGRFGLDIANRFYLGAALAVLCLVWLAARRIALNPLFVGANLWLCLEAIAIGSGIGRMVRLSDGMGETAFFAALLVTGMVYMAVSSAGLFTRGDHDGRNARRGSVVLLVLIAAALAWSISWRGDELIAAVLPATLIFTIQQVWPKGRQG